MSEYQFVAFRAIDRPLTKQELAFMAKQSSRAEITSRSFENEYHYGDFRGNAMEMLRRGYDFHLHYANYGTRTLLFRFPNGLANDADIQPYCLKDSLRFSKDKGGPGATISIDPANDAGTVSELWELGEFVERLIPLRAEILEGDLRPLYLAHLAVALDMNHDPKEFVEAPVPAGLDKPTDAQVALMKFLDLDESLVAAAAIQSPNLSPQVNAQADLAKWLKGKAQTKKDQWLLQLALEPDCAVRNEIMIDFRMDRAIASWPTVSAGRTIAELRVAAEDIARQAELKAEQKAARQKANRLAAISADPDKTLRETEELMNQRGRGAYRQIAELLGELREALAGRQSSIAEQKAQELKRKNPTLRVLHSELRRAGFLAKKGVV